MNNRLGISECSRVVVLPTCDFLCPAAPGTSDLDVCVWFAAALPVLHTLPQLRQTGLAAKGPTCYNKKIHNTANFYHIQ